MQVTDREAFDKLFERLCAAFNTPPTSVRREAYWQAFEKLALRDFTVLISKATGGDEFDSMPTTGALWKLHRKAEEPARQTGAQAATLQERLMAYAARKAFGRLSPVEFSRPWTYRYREWTADGKRCAECTSVAIDLESGAQLVFTVADMIAEAEARQLSLSP
jgi:hypothetical protein